MSEDTLKFLGFDGKAGDAISLPVSKTLRHDIAPSIEFTADFVLTGITKSNYIGYSYGGITGIVGTDTAEQLLPEEYLYWYDRWPFVNERHHHNGNKFFLPEIFIVQNTSELQNLISANSTGKLPFLVISAAITLFFAFMAAIPAAKYAEKVPPTVAMSGWNIKVKRRNRKSKTIRNFEAYYARLNLKRNRGRTAITVVDSIETVE